MSSEGNIILMPEPFQKLYSGLIKHLESIEQEHQSSVNRLKSCAIIAKKTADNLREYVLAHPFKSEDEEIQFFRSTKPQFYCHLIYFLKIYSIELCRPVGSEQDIEEFLQKELKAIRVFFDNNAGFYKYYRSGSSSLDSTYFLRSKKDDEINPESLYPDADPLFSTRGDHQVAKILANEMLSFYLKNSLERQLNKAVQGPIALNSGNPLKWTAPKAALIEIIYSLQSYGAFNNGAADIKEIASYLQEVFHVELGNYYHSFLEIRLRKKSRTLFLDELTEKLIQRMNEADEN